MQHACPQPVSGGVVYMIYCVCKIRHLVLCVMTPTDGWNILLIFLCMSTETDRLPTGMLHREISHQRPTRKHFPKPLFYRVTNQKSKYLTLTNIWGVPPCCLSSRQLHKGASIKYIRIFGPPPPCSHFCKTVCPQNRQIFGPPPPSVRTRTYLMEAP